MPKPRKAQVSLDATHYYHSYPPVACKLKSIMYYLNINGLEHYTILTFNLKDHT